MSDRYDAGLLNDFGGGNVDWWQDYISAELDRAHDFYSAELDALEAQVAAADRLAEAAQILVGETWRFDHPEATPALADAYVKAMTPPESAVNAALAAYLATKEPKA